MSYCRWGEADIYVYPSEQGYECCACFQSRDAAAFVAHIQEHINDGADVPDDLIERIRADDAVDRWEYQSKETRAQGGRTVTANAIADAKKLKKILAAMRNLVNMHAFACLILTGVTGIYISEGWSENPAWFNTVGVLIALFWFWQAVNAVKASGMAKAMENLIDQKLAGR